MVSLATFKSPSAIDFQVSLPAKLKRPRLKDTKRGDVFLWQADHGRHDAAICMRTTVSAYQYAIKQSQGHQAVLAKAQSEGIWIINLQTGRTFVSNDCEIDYVKIKVVVEGV